MCRICRCCRTRSHILTFLSYVSESAGCTLLEDTYEEGVNDVLLRKFVEHFTTGQYAQLPVSAAEGAITLPLNTLHFTSLDCPLQMRSLALSGILTFDGAAQLVYILQMLLHTGHNMNPTSSIVVQSRFRGHVASPLAFLTECANIECAMASHLW